MSKNKSDKKYTKKKLIITLIIIFSVLLVLYIITSIIPLLEKDQEKETEESEIIADFDFYPADYSEDIFTDEEYTKLIKNGILKYDNGVNSINTVFQEDFKNSNEPHAIMCKMIYSIIEGDEKEYNSYFSEKYFDSNSRKEKFTPQKIYNATLKLKKAELIQEKTATYNKYIFELKYCIYKNNGTFRKDIGDDNYRTQYFVVTNRTGTLLIDSIIYPEIKVSNSAP